MVLGVELSDFLVNSGRTSDWENFRLRVLQPERTSGWVMQGVLRLGELLMLLASVAAMVTATAMPLATVALFLRCALGCLEAVEQRQ